jgi:hypothetical protein
MLKSSVRLAADAWRWALTRFEHQRRRRNEMRHFFFLLIVAGLVCVGCSGRGSPDPETKLFREFSLSEIVGRVSAPELSGASASNGYSSSPGVSGRKDFSITYMLGEGGGAAFDEGSFIRELKAEAERAADDAGVRRGGGGSSGDAFHIDYSDAGHEGWIEVVGARVGGDRYKVWGVIRERVKSAKQ